MKAEKRSLFHVSLIITVSIIVLVLSGCRKSEGSPETVSAPEAVLTVPAAPVPDTDTVSAASSTYYFEENSLTAEELIDAIHDLSGGALAVSTVNVDGSPNLAFAGPDMITDDVLMFGLSANQTRKNIIERKIAVVGVYLFDPDTAEGISGSRGARLVLKLIEDSGRIEELKKLVPEAPDDVLFMKIVRVLPVG